MKKEVLNQAIDRLRSEGLRQTQTRKNLVNLILSKSGHWTIQQLALEVKDKSPKIGTATVYRTVKLLHEHEFLTETHLSGSTSRFEVAPDDHHDHLTCTTCGEIFEFENDKIEKLQREVASSLGFQLIDHRMELYADCRRPHCKGRQKKK